MTCLESCQNDTSMTCHEGVCYQICTGKDTDVSTCVCINAAKEQFLCRDNTACLPGYKGNPCIPPLYGLLTTCNNRPTHCYLCLNKQCISCENGYYLENGNCKKCNEFTEHSCTCNHQEFFNCEQCINNEEDLCKSCYNQYYLWENKCFQCPGPTIRNSCICGGTMDYKCRECADEYDSLCETCFNGYFNNEGICEECGGINQAFPCYCGFTNANNCGQCATDGSQSCSSCLKGYYLSDNLCLKCPTGCTECDSAERCTVCDYNYVIAKKAGAQVCFQCGFEQEAKDNECRCRSGYVKLSKCESVFAVIMFSLVAGLNLLLLLGSWVYYWFKK